MAMKTIGALCVTGFIVVAVCIGLVGCETQSATTKVTIEPSAATIGEGESVTFVASGGYDYTWELETKSYGTLSTTSGDTTTYTSTYSAGTSNTVVQVLTLTSFIENSSTSNSSPDEWTTEAYITQY